MAFVDLCRLCGTDTLNIVRNAIFEGEGRAKKYASKISECLTLQVTEEDELPKIMCGECSFKLELLSFFRDKACKTETDLISKSEANKVKTKVGGSKNEDINESRLELKSDQEPQVEIKENESPAINPQSRKRATKRSIRESESEEKEEVPAKNRPQKPKQPPAATTPVAAPPKEFSGADWKADFEKCQVCHQNCLTEAEFGTCINTRQKVKIQLPTEKQVPTVNNLNSDLALSFKKAEISMPIASNVECNFSSPVELEAHRNEVHYLQAQQFSCDICEKAFHLKSSLKVHMPRHTQLRPFACDFAGCSYSGKVATDLRRHKQTVHYCFIFYTCLMCGRSIKRPDHYKRHVAKHNTETPGIFKCIYGGCKKSAG